MKLVLTATFDFQSPDELRGRLIENIERAIHEAATDGRFASGTDATLDSYVVDVSVRAATVRCQFCRELVPAQTAHLHQGDWVGDDCCWDERLRSSA